MCSRIITSRFHAFGGMRASSAISNCCGRFWPTDGAREMVRYLHYEAERILDHIQSKQLAVTRCDFQKKSAPIEVAPSPVTEMLEKSQTLWGGALPHYLYVSQSFKIEAPSLNDAVSNVEALA